MDRGRQIAGLLGVSAPIPQAASSRADGAFPGAARGRDHEHAVAGGRLAPSTAVRALHEIDAESEEAWLEDAIAGLLPAPRKCDRRR